MRELQESKQRKLLKKQWEWKTNTLNKIAGWTRKCGNVEPQKSRSNYERQEEREDGEEENRHSTRSNMENEYYNKQQYWRRASNMGDDIIRRERITNVEEEAELYKVDREILLKRIEKKCTENNKCWLRMTYAKTEEDDEKEERSIRVREKIHLGEKIKMKKEYEENKEKTLKTTERVTKEELRQKW